MDHQAATERVTTLMTPAEKAGLESRARDAGVSVGEFVRRSVQAYDPAEAAAMAQLAVLSAELGRSNLEAAEALDRALASVEKTFRQLHRREHA